MTNSPLNAALNCVRCGRSETGCSSPFVRQAFGQSTEVFAAVQCEAWR